MVFIVILLAAFLFQLVLPWWISLVISFAICGLIAKTAKIAFWSPFFAICILWIAMALFKSLPNYNILAGRVAEMLSLKAWWMVLLLTGILGGLVAAISGVCGYHFRKAVLLKKTNN